MNQPQSNHHVLIVEEPNFKKTVVLKEATYSLGRHSTNDIIITSQKVSRHHATLLRRTDVKTNNYSYWILDGDLQGNRSRNGIFINGKKCLVHELKNGDIIKLSRDIHARYSTLSNLVPEESVTNYAYAAPVKKIAESRYNEQKTLFGKDTIIHAEQEIKTNKSSELLRLSSFAELSPQAIIEVDLEGNLTYTNSTTNLLFQDIQKKGINHSLIKGLHTRCNNENVNFLREVRIKNNFYQQNAYYLADHKLIRSYIRDITKEKNLETKIEEQTKQYNIIFEASLQGIIEIDAQTRQIIEINQAACNYFKSTKINLINKNIEDYTCDPQDFIYLIEKVIKNKEKFTGTIGFKKEDKTSINLDLDINLFDSETEQKIFLILKQENHFDLLSSQNRVNNLPQIEVLKENIENAIANCQRNKKLLATAVININNFANLENAISQEKKNNLLFSFAERLKACLRFGDTVAYSERDNFFILMEDVAAIQEVARISQRILDSLQQTFKIGEQQLSIVANIGIAVYPQDGEDADTLLTNANLALSRILKEENCCYQFYNSTMNSQNSVLLKLESFLHNALERDEFILYYQPQINVNNGNIQGVEALLRWQHPELGLVSPNSFITLAEETGLIVPIGQWVLRTACKQNKIWHSQGFPPLRVSVNLSPIQFQQPDLSIVVSQILAETDLNSNLLELEIAASTVMNNLEYSHNILSQLQKIGVHISIDDFSANQTSWEQLKHLPFDTLKINRDFVRQLKNDPQDLAVISSMVALGKGFNMRVVAEGVETQQQIEILRSQECEQMQGFWFSRPLAAEEATKLLPFDYLE